MILLIFVSTVCAVSTDIREIVIDTSLIVFQESNWNYFKVKPTSDEIFYLSVRVRIDLKNQVLLAISNDGYPTINSGVIQADWADIENYNLEVNSYNIILDPGTYAINTLIIGVYSASKINYLISVKETSEKPCLNLCSDNGVCNRGTCSCDQNFIGKDCQTYASELSLDVDQQFVVSGKSKRYLFYDFKNDENRIDVDISVNDSSNDREIIVYTKPYSKNSTTLPSENEYYNKMTGTNIKFTLENNDGDKFFITIENEISGQTSFRIALKKPSGDDGNKATLYMIIGISSGLFLVVLTLVLYIKFKKNTRNLPIDADKARAIDISQIEAHYPETAYEHKDDDMPCSICLENFVINEMVRKLTCDHMYHKKCIDEWFLSKTYCCMCRKDAKNADISLFARYVDDNTTLNGGLNISFSFDADQAQPRIIDE